MIRCCAIAALIFGSLVQSAAAQPPAPEPSKSPIRLLPNYIATDQPKDSRRQSEPRPGPVPLPLETPPATMPPWEHLMTAAEHLEAAGLKAEADELRERARRQKNKERLSTEQLRRELDRLRGKLDALQKQVANTQQIEIRLTMIEFFEERLREAGAELPALLRSVSARGGVVEDPAALLRQIDELRERGLLKVLAEPTLITTNGRPASMLIGGEFPIPVVSSSGEKKTDWREFGVRLEAIAHILHGRKLRLEVQPTISEPDFSPPQIPGGTEVPGLTTKRVNIAIETNAGETVVIGGLRSQRRDASTRSPDGKARTETTQLFVLVTADIVQRGGSPDNPAPPPVRN